MSRCHAVEKPSSDESSTKMKTEKKAMKTPMYLYSVTRKEVAPSAMASMRSAAFWTICVVLCVCVGGGGGREREKEGGEFLEGIEVRRRGGGGG